MRDLVLKGSSRPALAVSLVLGLMFTGGLVLAGKPQKPPAEPLTAGIYYAYENDLWVMDSDGNNNAMLVGVGGMPSRELHGGERWFLKLRGTGDYYPDGKEVKEFFVTNQANTISVQVTDDSLNQKRRMVDNVSGWASGDQAISWAGHTWVWDENTQEYVVDEAGIYYLPIVFDLDDVDGDGELVETDGDVSLAVDSDFWQGETQMVYEIGKGVHSWSPDNSRIVHTTWDDETETSTLHITDIATPNDRTDLTGGSDPEWSAADTIVFRNEGISVINPDGSGQTELVGDKKGGVGNPHFSPDGLEVVYTVHSARGGTAIWSIYKTSVSSPSPRSLGTEGMPRCWR